MDTGEAAIQRSATGRASSALAWAARGLFVISVVALLLHLGGSRPARAQSLEDAIGKTLREVAGDTAPDVGAVRHTLARPARMLGGATGRAKSLGDDGVSTLVTTTADAEGITREALAGVRESVEDVMQPVEGVPVPELPPAVSPPPTRGLVRRPAPRPTAISSVSRIESPGARFDFRRSPTALPRTSFASSIASSEDAVRRTPARDPAPGKRGVAGGGAGTSASSWDQIRDQYGVLLLWLTLSCLTLTDLTRAAEARLRPGAQRIPSLPG
jgi:hypothetical protein